MKQKLLYILLICLLIGLENNAIASDISTSHLLVSHYNGPFTDNNNKLNSGFFNSLNILNCPGFPRFCSFDIRELAFTVGALTHIFPISTDNAVSIQGAAQTTSYQSSTIEYITISQNYKYNQTAFSLYIQVLYLPNGNSGIDNGNPSVKANAGIIWPNGIPPWEQYGQVLNAGIVMRTDWDPYYGCSNSGFDVAGGDYLYHSNTAPYINDALWGNANNKVLARLYDTQWPIRTASTADMYWVNEYPKLTYLISHTPALYSEGTYYWNQAASKSDDLFALQRHQKTVPNDLPDFILPEKGQDLVSYFEAANPIADYTSLQYTNIALAMNRQIGSRSLYMRWYYSAPQYGDPNYKVTSGGESHSFVDALTELIQPASLYQNNDVLFGRFQQTLTCPGGSCTDQELCAIDYANYPETGEDFKRLNTAVYCLAPDQHYYSDDATHKTYGIAYAGTSRAFVFPGTCQTLNKTYFTIAHEMGHTLGMAHQWSNCNQSDNWDGNNFAGWNCNKGTIMSYSTNGVFSYGQDAQTWYKKVPLGWISPRWGFGTTKSGLKVGDLVNW